LFCPRSGYSALGFGAKTMRRPRTRACLEQGLCLNINFLARTKIIEFANYKSVDRMSSIILDGYSRSKLDAGFCAQKILRDISIYISERKAVSRYRKRTRRGQSYATETQHAPPIEDIQNGGRPGLILIFIAALAGARVNGASIVRYCWKISDLTGSLNFCGRF
jgi:hypothetical protein